MNLFIETSALVTRYLPLPGGEMLDRAISLVLDRGGSHYTSRLVALDTLSTLAAHYRSGALAREAYIDVSNRLEIDCADLFALIPIDDDRTRAVVDLAIAQPSAPVRALERLHVEAAKRAQEFEAEPVAFVTCKPELAEYVRSRRLTSWNPQVDGIEVLLKLPPAF